MLKTKKFILKRKDSLDFVPPPGIESIGLVLKEEPPLISVCGGEKEIKKFVEDHKEIFGPEVK